MRRMALFGTAGIRGGVERVGPDLAVAVGRAAASHARTDDTGTAPTFVVGRDGRRTSEGIAAAVTAGLAAGGATVRRVGTVPTPALARAARDRRGVMVTASHNPPTDNGLKLFVDGVEYDREAERAVEARVEDDTNATWDAWGSVERATVLEAYRDGVVEYAETHGAPLDGLRVAVDCGNGMGGLATPQVLRALGGSVVTLHANVDGHFPGRAPKPTRESTADLRAFVADDDTALAVAHDGDADRIVVVGPDGEPVDRNTVLAVLAEHYVRRSDSPDPVVVTTPDASARIDDRVEAAEGRVERVRLGALHEGIARSSGDVVFAAEPWKHIHPDWGGWIDGVASAAVFARLVADRGLDRLCEPVDERPYRKTSVDCPDDRKDAVMTRMRERLPEAFPDATVDEDHGVRLDMPDGSWILVRPSGTEPKIRVYGESEALAELLDRTTGLVADAVEQA